VTPDIREADAPNDPQPNPTDQPDKVTIMPNRFNADAELKKVVKSLKAWLPQNPEATVAILVPRNTRGKFAVEALREAGLEVVELLQSTSQTREITSILTTVLRCLAYPTNARFLANAYEKVYAQEAASPDTASDVKLTADLLARIFRMEDYLQPRTAGNWLDALPEAEASPELRARLESFRDRITRWQAATLLPPDQLILLVAQDLFTDPVALALAHKIALLIESTAVSHPTWRLPEFVMELDEIANNRRKMLGFSEDDTGFDPEKHRGKVVVATVHKAKGLEWDRVYLLSINNYDYPSCQPGDSFIGERWFVRNKQNLPAETLARLKALMENDVSALYLEEGIATEEARYTYAAERLRLLYVGITRAKKELVITWNTGKNDKYTEALPLSALRAHLEEEQLHAYSA
jgi:DNA helicase-2/ATP-dependent DNA helicase PcrA